MKPKPIKIARKSYSYQMVNEKYVDCIYNIEDCNSVQIKPQKPNDAGVYSPPVCFCFKNTMTHLFLINVSRTEEGNYIFGYDFKHGAYGGGSSCWPSKRWRFNKPKADSIRKCLINAMNYIINYEFWFGEYDKELREAAAEVLKKLRRGEVYQMTIFDILNE